MADIIWSYILPKGYCTFGCYSSAKRIKVIDEDGNAAMERNENYLPKSKLKRPKDARATPRTSA